MGQVQMQKNIYELEEVQENRKHAHQGHSHPHEEEEEHEGRQGVECNAQ